MKRIISVALLASALALTGVPGALASPSPNGPGQPGAPNNTCGPSNLMVPGGSGSASGSPFNGRGTAGTVYAGNPGTASLANAASAKAVSQYDIACFQLSH